MDIAKVIDYANIRPDTAARDIKKTCEETKNIIFEVIKKIH